MCCWRPTVDETSRHQPVRLETPYQTFGPMLAYNLFICQQVCFRCQPLGPNARCKTDTTSNRTPSPHYTKNLTSYNKESNDSLVAASLRGFANKECSVSARRLTRPVSTNPSGCKCHTSHLVEIYLFVSSLG